MTSIGESHVQFCKAGFFFALFAVFSSLSASASVQGVSLPDSPVDTPLSFPLSAPGAAAPISWVLAAGTLPKGVGLRPNGTLAGTPSTTGLFTFSAEATDATGASSLGVFSIRILPAPLAIVAPSPLASGMVTVDYPVRNLAATGGVPPYTFALSSGALPAGVTLAPDGTISGTATVAGTSTFAVTVTDSSGINPASPAATATLKAQIRPYSLDLILSDGSLQFSLAAGTAVLPVGQNFQVQSTDVSTVLNYTVEVTPAVPWLAVTPTGSTPGAANVTLTSAASTLPASTTPYTATIEVTCVPSGPCAGSTQTIAVSLIVASIPPQLRAVNDLLSFTGSSLARQPVTQSLLLAASGSGSVGIESAACEASWCTAGATLGSIQAGETALLNVTVNPDDLSPGYYSTSVTIVSSAGTTVVPVTFLVTPYESLALDPSATLLFLQQPAPITNGGVASFAVGVQGDQPVNWTATLLPGADWLKLNTLSGTSTAARPGTVTYTVDPAATAALPLGVYYATVRIAASGVANSPLDFQLVFDVVGADAKPKPLPVPAGLIFNATAGSAPPPAQVVLLTTNAAGDTFFQVSAATEDGTDWLVASPHTGVTTSTSTGQTTVSVNTAGLSAGIYRGTITYAYHVFGVRTVSVTLILRQAAATASRREPTTPVWLDRATPGCSPATLVPTQTSLYANFSATVAWPAPISIQLLDDCATPVANGQVTVTFSNGDPPLLLDLTDATAAVYSGTWTPRSIAPQLTVSALATAPGFAAARTTLPGAVTPNVAPLLNHNAILNAFSPQEGAPLAPGTVVEIFGSNLASQTMTSSTFPLPDTVQGTQVIIGGLEAPILFVSPNQVNVQVPFELAPGQPYDLVLSANGALTVPEPVQISTVSPGVAELSGGQIIAQHLDAAGTLVTDGAPAKPGEFIALYLDGLGLTDVPVASGAASPSSPLARAVTSPSLTLDGEPVKVLFAGLTPGLAGLYQMDVQVPSDAKDGDLIVRISQAGTGANTGILAVHH